LKTRALKILIARALGGGGAILLMIELAEASGAPLMWIPFATSIVMIMGSPEAPPAQPHRFLGGHLVCALAGVICTMLLGHEMWVAALAVGLAIMAMHLTDTFHPDGLRLSVSPAVRRQMALGGYLLEGSVIIADAAEPPRNFNSSAHNRSISGM
jgi:CBS-domain-containing membrane protein